MTIEATKRKNTKSPSSNEELYSGYSLNRESIPQISRDMRTGSNLTFDGPGDDEITSSVMANNPSNTSSLFGVLTPPERDTSPSGFVDPPSYVHCVRPKEPTQKTEKKKRNRRKKKGTDTTDGQQSMSEKRDSVFRTVKSLGYTDDEIRIATKRIEESEQELSYDSLIDMAYNVQNEQLEQSVAADAAASGIAKTESDEESVGSSEREAEESENEAENVNQVDFETRLRRAIDKRKMEIRDAIDELTFQCQVCHCSRATILLLPCGHLASCDSCLMDVRRCPVSRCNKIVRGTKEVYFA